MAEGNLLDKVRKILERFTFKFEDKVGNAPKFHESGRETLKGQNNRVTLFRFCISVTSRMIKLQITNLIVMR